MLKLLLLLILKTSMKKYILTISNSYLNYIKLLNQAIEGSLR